MVWSAWIREGADEHVSWGQGNAINKVGKLGRGQVLKASSCAEVE